MKAVAAALVLALGGTAAAQSPRDHLTAVQVFVALAQRTGEGEREEYLKAHAGRVVAGAGHVEAVIPRTYFDTSVPPHNPAVALIQVSDGRKVACGLPAPLTSGEFAGFREGSPLAFRGQLADGIPWGEWTTLYLSDCQIQAQ